MFVKNNTNFYVTGGERAIISIFLAIIVAIIFQKY
jgi:hypothetical protein